MVRDREARERELIEAAWRLFARDGVLSGLNLKEVAAEAGANRGLIYHYFGSREELLKAALAHRVEEARATFDDARHLPFTERRTHAFATSIADPTYARLVAQMVLADGEVTLMPLLERTREALARDVAEGAVPEAADPVVAHAMTVICYLGYGVFRDAVAAELDLDPEELDERATAVFRRMVEGLAAGGMAQEPADED